MKRQRIDPRSCAERTARTRISGAVDPAVSRLCHGIHHACMQEPTHDRVLDAYLSFATAALDRCDTANRHDLTRELMHVAGRLGLLPGRATLR